MALTDDFKTAFRRGNAVQHFIYINVGFYLLYVLTELVFWLFGHSHIADHLSMWVQLPASLSSFIYKPWTLLTALFFHKNLLHIFFNMLWLYWLGNIFNEHMGNTKSYQAYVLGGIFGGLLYIISFNVFPVFSQAVAYNHAYGASAGVLAMVVAAATLLPSYPVHLFILGEVKLSYIALFSIALDLISISGSGNAGGHIAHLGGALFGFLFVKMQYSNSHIPVYLDRLTERTLNIFKPKSTLKIHYRTQTTYMRSTFNDNPSQQDIDAVLDKISKSGYESLNQKEKEILFKASKD